MLLAFSGCLSCGAENNGPSSGSDVYYADGGVGGWVCEDPTATGSDVLDILAMKLERAGSDVVVTIAFSGDIEAHDAAVSEKLQISVQLWLGDVYVETFFSDKTSMKVVDGKAGVSYSLDGNKIAIRLTGLQFDLISRFVANSIVSGYPEYDGLCTDSLGGETADPAALTPVDLPGVIRDPNNDLPPDNNELPEGPQFIMLTDLSPSTTGDYPGSDIDRVEVCKSANSDCTVADVVVEEASGVVNSAGLAQSGGADACTNGTFASLAGGYAIVTFSDPSVVIVEGDSIRVFGLPELLCAEAGPDDEQTFSVSIGDTNVVDQFELVGDCATSIPCRLTVPAGL